MLDLNFPILSGNESCFPPEADRCPVCSELIKGGVCLSLGAHLMDREEKSGLPADDLDGFMSLDAHFESDDFCTLEIMEDVRYGQGEIYLCSFECTRKFFNHIVSKLEEKYLKLVKDGNNV